MGDRLLLALPLLGVVEVVDELFRSVKIASGRAKPFTVSTAHCSMTSSRYVFSGSVSVTGWVAPTASNAARISRPGVCLPSSFRSVWRTSHGTTTSAFVRWTVTSSSRSGTRGRLRQPASSVVPSSATAAATRPPAPNFSTTTYRPRSPMTFSTSGKTWSGSTKKCVGFRRIASYSPCSSSMASPQSGLAHSQMKSMGPAVVCLTLILSTCSLTARNRACSWRAGLGAPQASRQPCCCSLRPASG
jgi:hypothetical protein